MLLPHSPLRNGEVITLAAAAGWPDPLPPSDSFRGRLAAMSEPTGSIGKAGCRNTGANSIERGWIPAMGMTKRVKVKRQGGRCDVHLIKQCEELPLDGLFYQ